MNYTNLTETTSIKWINSKKVGSIKVDLYTKTLKKHGFIAFLATAYICYKRAIPQRIPPYAVCRYSSARVASQRCPILYYSSRIIHKHAVALKALNPMDFKIKILFVTNFFGVESFKFYGLPAAKPFALCYFNMFSRPLCNCSSN
jgi:hypothetical protein